MTHERAALCFATYLYFSSDYIQRFGPQLYASHSTAISCLAILLHGGLGGRWGEGHCPDRVGHGYLLHGFAKAGMLGTSGLLCPLFVGVLLFDEPKSPLRLTGAGCVVLSVIVLSWKKVSLPGQPPAGPERSHPDFRKP